MTNTTDSPSPTRTAVFLDRDGTLIDYVPYLSNPEQVRLIPGAGESLAAMKNAGFHLVLITNQSGIGRGLYSERDYEAVNDRIAELLGDFGVTLDRIEFCPHTPEDGCGCRKPATGMAESAVTELGISLTSSFVIGDNLSDIEFGRAIGAATILVETGLGKEHRNDCADLFDHFVPSIKDAADIVLGERDQ
jgi:histidinol-phosphate phosphatase family protein